MVSLFFTAYVNYLSKTVIDVIRLVESKHIASVQFRDITPPPFTISKTNLIERPKKDSALFILRNHPELKSKAIKDETIIGDKEIILSPKQSVYAKKEIKLGLTVHPAAELKPQTPSKNIYLTFNQVTASSKPKKKFKEVRIDKLKNPELKLTHIIQEVYGPAPQIKGYRYDIKTKYPLKLVPTKKDGFKKLVWDESGRKIKSISSDIVYPNGVKYGEVEKTRGTAGPPIKAELKYAYKSGNIHLETSEEKAIEGPAVFSRHSGPALLRGKKKSGNLLSSPLRSIVPGEMIKTTVAKENYNIPVTTLNNKVGGIMLNSEKLVYQQDKPGIKVKPLSQEIKVTFKKPVIPNKTAAPIINHAQKPLVKKAAPEKSTAKYIIENADEAPIIINKELTKPKSIPLETKMHARQIARTYTKRQLAVVPTKISPNENIRLMEQPKAIFKSNITHKKMNKFIKNELIVPKMVIFSYNE